MDQYMKNHYSQSGGTAGGASNITQTQREWDDDEQGEKAGGANNNNIHTPIGATRREQHQNQTNAPTLNQPQPGGGMIEVINRMGAHELSFIKKELEAQRLYYEDEDGLTTETIKSEITHSMDLTVLAFMGDGSPGVQLVHSVGTFVSQGAGGFKETVVGIMGQPEMLPVPVALKPRTTWLWGTVDEVSMDHTEFAAYINSEDYEGKLWQPKERDEKVTIPKFVRIPLTLVEWLLGEERTPMDLYGEIMRRVSNETLPGVEEMELLRDWCLLASQCHEGDTTKSVLQSGVDGMTMVTKDMQRWVKKKLDMIFPQQHQAAGSPAVPGGPPDMAQVMEFTQRTVNSVCQLAKETITSSNNNEKKNTKSEGGGTKLTPYLLYLLLGWSGGNTAHDLGDYWFWQEDKTLKQRREELIKRMNEWATANGCEIDPDFFLSEDNMKMIHGLKFHPGGQTIFKTAEQGMSVLLGIGRTAAERAELELQEEAENASRDTRTFDEYISLNQKDPRPPANTLPAARMCIHTYAALLYVLFTRHCDHYIKVKGIIDILKGHVNETSRYNAYKCRMLAWIIIVDSRLFFKKTMTEQDMAQGLPGPSSVLEGYFFNLMQHNPITNGTFPSEWQGTKKKEQLPRAPAPPSGVNPYAAPPPPQRQQQQPPPSNQDVQARVAHVHPHIKQKMSAFHNQFEGRIDMRPILGAGNIAYNDLPEHPTARHRLCWQHVLGRCKFQDGCHFDHVDGNVIPDQFAKNVCEVIGRGVAQLLANPPQHGYLVGNRGQGRGNKRQRGY